jgi:hypothetical protein
MPIATFPALLIATFVVVSWKLFNGPRAMEIRKHSGVVVSRHESPMLLWIVIALQRFDDWRLIRDCFVVHVR